MKSKTIIIKYGSGVVTGQNGMDDQRLSGYVRDIIKVHSKYNIVLVSSGSVAVGRTLWGRYHSKATTADVKMHAMMGSALAFFAWQQALLSMGILSGQLLVTHREVDDPTEGPSLLSAIKANMSRGVITIINENDALSDTELAKLSYGGDNDGLASHIATKLKADALLLLTDVDGLKRDGRVESLVAYNSLAREQALDSVYAGTSTLGRGGMQSKVEAALRASGQGVEAYIASAGANLNKVLSGSSGTHFVANHNNE